MQRYKKSIVSARKSTAMRVFFSTSEWKFAWGKA